MQEIDHEGFEELLSKLAIAWAGQDADAAVACFTPDAVYMEPPDVQLFVGSEELRSYFGPLVSGTYLDLHNIWFDQAAQIGAVEFGFGVRGESQADYGVAVVTLVGGKISFWREYQRKGPATFSGFIGSEGKTWQWHIGNYP